MDSTFYNQVMALLIPAAVTALTLLISLGLHKLRKFVESQTNNQVTMFAFGRLEDICRTTVDELNQSVKVVAEDGRITPEEAKMLKEMAMKRVLSQIPPDLAAVLDKSLGDLRSWVNSKIEQAVYDAK